MPIARRIALAGAFAALAATAAPAAAQPTSGRDQHGDLLRHDHVEMHTPDGFTLYGTLRVPQTTPAPGVVLIHMHLRNHLDWSDFARELQDAGIASLAIDLRGHGASTQRNGETVTIQEMMTAPGYDEFHAMALDVDAAYRHLASVDGVDADRMAVVGASVGANVTLKWAAAERPRGLRGLVLLSAGRSYQTLTAGDYVTQIDVPMLFVSGDRDPISGDHADYLVGLAGDDAEHLTLRCRVGGVPQAHGTNLLQFAPEASDRLIPWLAEKLGAAGAD
jgi:pimeloyl-ACP methyl ester carboxylesterase